MPRPHLLAMLLLLPAAASLGQDTTTLKLSSRIVVLDVVVTDKQGHLIPNLTRDDFTIVEDKIPQTIRSFEAPSAHTQPSDVVVHSAADLARIADAPVTLLVLDELNTRFEDNKHSRDSLIQFLRAQPPVLHQPTVLLVATNTRFAQLHDYTQDREALIAAIDHHLPEYPSKLMSGGRNSDIAVERMAQSLAALEQIAQASSGTPGRKNVLWVGNGFPSANLVGLDDKTIQTILAAIRQCTDMLLASRVTLYTINPTLNSTSVLDVTSPYDLEAAETENGGDPFGAAVDFSNLAPATGGTAYRSRNDVNNEIAEGIAAGATYYTLSYAPTNRSDDAQKYRNIRIVMRDPNLRATTRDGYYPATSAPLNPATAEPPKQAAAQLQLDISSAVNSAISYNGLEVHATHEGANYVLKVKSSGLNWSPADSSSEKAEATVIAAWYDVKGKLLGHSGKELIATRSVSDNPPASEATFTLPVATLPPGATRIRLVVRDAVTAHMGTTDLKP